MPSSSYEVIQIISCAANGRLSFNAEGFKSVLDRIPNIPIVIYSIAGKYRIGKSFLMSSLIPVLEHYERYGSLTFFRKDDLDFHMHGFVFKSGDDSTTKGIHLLNKPFIVRNPNNRNEKVAILLMDSQGLDAIDINGGVDQEIFTLTNFLSSHVIYNVCGNIEPKKLLSLIELASHSKDHRKDTFSSLDVLIRDYKFRKSDIQEMKKESLSYVNDICNTKGSIVGNDLRELKEYFRFVNCYPLPNPGRKVEYDTFTGDKNEINNKFIELLYDYILILFDSNHIYSKFENGKKMFELFRSLCSRTLNRDRINADEFYRLITESKDYRIINNFVSQYLDPLKFSYSDFNSMLQLKMRINNVRNEYNKIENSVYDKSKLSDIHFEYEIANIESKFRQKLENERIEEQRRIENQRLQEEQNRQRKLLDEQKAEQERKRRELERLNYQYYHPPPPTVIRHDDDGPCQLL